jgi:hypothetical protein
MVSTGEQLRLHLESYVGENWKERIHPGLMPYKGDNAIKAELVRSGAWITPLQQGGAWKEDGSSNVFKGNFDAVLEQSKCLDECIDWMRR